MLRGDANGVGWRGLTECDHRRTPHNYGGHIIPVEGDDAQLVLGAMVINQFEPPIVDKPAGTVN